MVVRSITASLWLVLLQLFSLDAAAADLRVISFNVWGVPVVSPQRVERIDEMARQLARLTPDFVALQEVWEDDDAARIGRTLRAAGLEEQRHFGAREVGGRGSGLWIASRFPITAERFVPFETGGKPYIHWHLDYLSTKGVAVVEIATPRGTVAIANTHLQSTYTFGDYTFIQLAQALTITGAVADVESPLILVGDINAEPTSVVSKALTAQLGLIPASSELGIDIAMARMSKAASTTKLAPRVVAFDALFNEPVTFSNGKMRTLSDHPCLMIDYDLAPCSDCEQVSHWAETLPVLERFIDDNTADTAWFMTSMKALAVFSPLLIVWLGRLGRRRRVRGRKLVLAVLVLSTGLLAAGWFAYVGWSYCPHKLDALSQLRAKLRASVAAP